MQFGKENDTVFNVDLSCSKEQDWEREITTYIIKTGK